MFKRTLQQDKWFKEGACIKYKKQEYYARNCKQGQRTNIVKGTNTLYSKEKLKGIKEYIIRSFVFYYNNYYLIH